MVLWPRKRSWSRRVSADSGPAAQPCILERSPPVSVPQCPHLENGDYNHFHLTDSWGGRRESVRCGAHSRACPGEGLKRMTPTLFASPALLTQG